MMKKPKKKKGEHYREYGIGYEDGYNQACDDWEKYHKFKMEKLKESE